MEQMKREDSGGFPSELVSFYLLCARDPENKTLLASFTDSLYVSRHKTMQVTLWTCDNRAGLGNDNIFKAVASEIAMSQALNISFKIKIVKSLIRLSKWNLVVELLKYRVPAKLRIFIFNEIRKALKFGNINCAKSMPRNGAVANRIRGYLKLSPTEWRGVLVPLCSDMVTVLMSANKWSEIDYNKLPTHIIVQYFKAIKRHDRERFFAYLDATPARAITIYRIIRHSKPKEIMELKDVVELDYLEHSTRRFHR